MFVGDVSKDCANCVDCWIYNFKSEVNSKCLSCNKCMGITYISNMLKVPRLNKITQEVIGK